MNINLHHINCCFNIALPIFTHTNLVYVNINIGIFCLNVAPSQNLVFTPGASIRINTVFKQCACRKSSFRSVNVVFVQAAYVVRTVIGIQTEVHTPMVTIHCPFNLHFRIIKIFFLLSSTAIKQIQEWAKKSLLEKQYGCQKKARMWIDENHPVPDDVSSRYKWIKRTMAKIDVQCSRWNTPNVTQILGQDEIGNDPVSILLTGEIGRDFFICWITLLKS